MDEEADVSTGIESPWNKYVEAPLPTVVVLLLVLMILMPIELSLRAGTVFVPWYRLLLVIVAIPVVMRIVTGKVQLKFFDWCIIAHCLWVFASEMIKRGSSGIQPSFVFLLETMIAYLIMRCYMVKPGHFASFARILFVLMAISIVLAIPEAMVFKDRYIHTIARQITGYYYDIQYDYRLNMLRAASLFEHPILFGLFCSCALGLVWTTTKQQGPRLFKSGFLLLGVVLSASSAPILTAMLQIILAVGERVTRGIKTRLKLLVSGIFIAITVTSFFSNRGPFGIIATTLALNPQSAYYRIHIWNYTIDDVMRHPIIGFLPEQWTRPWWMSGSLDNHWLAQALRGGIPCVVFILFGIWLIWHALYKVKEVPSEFSAVRFGWSIMTVALVLGGATVAFFGKMHAFSFILLGYGAALSQSLYPNSSDTEQGPTNRRAPNSKNKIVRRPGTS